MMAIATRYEANLVELHDWLAKGVSQAQQRGGPVLLSYSQSLPALDPLDFFARARQVSEAAFFWERAEDSFTLAGAGAVYTFSGQGQSRFAQVEQEWRQLLSGAVIAGAANASETSGPILMGGFSFDVAKAASPQWQVFGDGRFVLPEAQVVAQNKTYQLTLNILVKASTDALVEAERLSLLVAQLCLPTSVQALAVKTEAVAKWDVMPAASWQNLVGQAVRRIKSGSFQKVVLARQVRARASEILDVAQALRRLRVGYPSATLFAVAYGESCFMAATPERLVRLCDGEVRTIGLAGSARRGQTEEEDQQLGRELLESEKNQEEHAIVVRMLRTALEKVCSYVWSEDRPHLLKLSNVQHLYTPVLGRLAADSRLTVLSLVEQLHPTPALGGYPRREALAWLRDNEGLDRGWYAAPVGWVNSKGEGEFVVAIRSALVEGAEASLYAGCGIVADSDPESEYAESCLKLKPMLTALGL